MQTPDLNLAPEHLNKPIQWFGTMTHTNGYFQLRGAWVPRGEQHLFDVTTVLMSQFTLLLSKKLI